MTPLLSRFAKAQTNSSFGASNTHTLNVSALSVRYIFVFEFLNSNIYTVLWGNLSMSVGSGNFCTRAIVGFRIAVTHLLPYLLNVPLYGQ